MELGILCRRRLCALWKDLKMAQMMKEGKRNDNYDTMTPAPRDRRDRFTSTRLR
jgi:hypothetical protein